MSKGRKLAAVAAAAVLMSTVPVTAFGAVITYNSNLFSSSNKSAESTIKDLVESGKMTFEEIAEMGPGYADAIKEQIGAGLTEALEEEETNFDGPVVKKVSLGERYHEEYKTYELSVADLFFLYANVGNGGITHEPVAIDIPANISYTMEKDGLPYEYVSQTKISAKGTYVMKLTGIENKELPLSEQVEYQAVYRFRITDEPPVEETEAAASGLAGAVGSLTGDNTFVVSGNSGAPIFETSETEAVQETDPVKEEEAPVEETEAEVDSKNETDAEMTEGPESEAAAEAEPTMSAKREQRMELASGNYIVTLENGKELTTSVPEGYVGAGSVYLNVAEDVVPVTALYKNDEPVEFINGESVTEYGRYRLDVDGCSYFFTLAYEVGQMEYYPAPVGMEFTEVRLNDELLTLASDQYATMEQDGTYSFVMKGNEGERFEVILVKDTVAPEMSVTVTKGSAAIEYLSDDIAVIKLIRDGKEVPGFAGTMIEEPGQYTLTVFDAAGNSTAADFSLKYQVNFYGILAVVLVVLAIAGIGVFVVHIKKNTKVR
ncbi:MAG: hypothetical protein IJO55_00515 [Lachnospiraceae bacterium]|nr:hypothetical protein [Lachnospiraceae bacterium]